MQKRRNCYAPKWQFKLKFVPSFATLLEFFLDGGNFRKRSAKDWLFISEFFSFSETWFCGSFNDSFSVFFSVAGKEGFRGLGLPKSTNQLKRSRFVKSWIVLQNVHTFGETVMARRRRRSFSPNPKSLPTGYLCSTRDAKWNVFQLQLSIWIPLTSQKPFLPAQTDSDTLSFDFSVYVWGAFLTLVRRFLRSKGVDRNVCTSCSLKFGLWCNTETPWKGTHRCLLELSS